MIVLEKIDERKAEVYSNLNRMMVVENDNIPRWPAKELFDLYGFSEKIDYWQQPEFRNMKLLCKVSGYKEPEVKVISTNNSSKEKLANCVMLDIYQAYMLALSIPCDFDYIDEINDYFSALCNKKFHYTYKEEYEDE